MTFPIELVFPFPDGTLHQAMRLVDGRRQMVTKTLKARNQEELDSLIKVGWKVQTLYKVIDGKTVGRILDAPTAEEADAS